MSTEEVNENQIDSLRRAVQTQRAADSAETPPAETATGPLPKNSSLRPEPTLAPVASSTPTNPQKRTPALTYDFKRPERVGKEQMRAIHSLHESLARGFSASISTMLRTMIEVKLVSVDQLTYSEFVFSLDNPSCFTILKPQPLEGHWILDIAPTLAYAFIDRMLGGDPTPGEHVSRPLTEIEIRLVIRVIRIFLDHLHSSWENILSLDTKIEKVESNPQLVQIIPPSEVIILVSFELMLGRNRGLIQLCIPFNSVERFNSQLSNNGWAGYTRAKPTDATRSAVAKSVDAAPVSLVVTLARSKIKTRDLLELNVGDIITTEQDASQPLEIAIQDVPKLHGKPGSFKGKKAILIETDSATS